MSQSDTDEIFVQQPRDLSFFHVTVLPQTGLEERERQRSHIGSFKNYFNHSLHSLISGTSFRGRAK